MCPWLLAGLNQTLELSEMTRQQLEDEIMVLNRERADITEQLNTVCTVMILSFRTDTPGQTVQTQIRLLLEVQSDQGLHCLQFRLLRLDSLLYGRATEFKF